MTTSIETVVSAPLKHIMAVTCRLFIESLERIRDADVEWLLPSHGPAFRHDVEFLNRTIERVKGYQHMADFGTCASIGRLIDQWEKELAEGKLPE